MANASGLEVIALSNLWRARIGDYATHYVLALLTAAYLAAPQVAACADGWTTDTLVSVAVTTATENQDVQQVVSDGAGGAIIVWADASIDARYDIFAQRLNGAGVAQWSPNGIPVCTAVEQQYAPQIAADGAGGVLITWIDYRDGSAWAIYSQRVSANGELMWSTNGDTSGIVVCDAPEDQGDPEIISDGSGGAIITWWGYNGSSTNIYAQRVSSTGQLLWTGNEPYGLSVCTAAGYQFLPQIASDGAGGAILSWMDGRDGSDDIYVQRVSGAGELLWTPGGDTQGVPIGMISGYEGEHQMVADGDGGAIVAWNSYPVHHSDGQIYAQKITSSGVTLWNQSNPTTGLAVSAASRSQQLPELVSDGAGGAIIAWTDYRNSTNQTFDIYAQRVTSTGNLEWALDGDTNGLPICSHASYKGVPRLVEDGSGGVVVVWYDGRDGNSDIYGQRVNGMGEKLWIAPGHSNGFPLSAAAVNQELPQIARHEGDVFVTWRDNRDSLDSRNNWDIYATRVALENGPEPPRPPATPGDAAITVTSTSLTLVWTDNALNETGYRVLRSVNKAPEVQVADLPADSKGYSDTDINKCSTFTYTVTAYNSQGKAPAAAVSHDNGDLPTITVLGDNPTTVAYGQQYSDAGATATDACGNVLMTTALGVENVEENVAAHYVITYHAVDANDKSTSATRLVIVEPENSAVQEWKFY